MPYKFDETKCRNLELSSRREWILTNGLGGYAMGTVSGINTRRYHGLLVASINPPIERMVLLANVEIFIQSEGKPVGISANQYAGATNPEGYQYIESFQVGKTATWKYRAAGMHLEKRIYVHKGKNACSIQFSNIGDKPFLLTLKPLVSHKFYHGNFTETNSYPQALTFPKNMTAVEDNGVALILSHEGAKRTPVQGWYYRFEHARELERGLNPRDDLFCPCELSYELLPGEQAVLTASVGEAVKPYDFSEPEGPTDSNIGKQLEEAAELFFVDGGGRNTIIAGYPWFGDWGRDTMISIPGLFLQTGRIAEARQILKDYSAQLYQGLIPNRFVEGNAKPEYNTVDGTLWFVNAIYKTLLAEWNLPFAKAMMKTLTEVYEWHVMGTLYGIKVDPEDGLLTQGEDGVQLTWMDAKVDDWVVTPRHGKPVEVNGLWINALRVMEWLALKLDKDGTPYRAAAEKAESNFDRKFWAPSRGHYLDTADPDDALLRPNQLIAMSLPFGPATGPHAETALATISQELITPVGIRTLGAHEPGYSGKFKGSLRELDSVYHQGTVWPWLIGPYVTAMVKITGDRQVARKIIRNAREMLVEYGIGGIAEVYDGDEPQSPGGCPWQAWSVSEILRAWAELEGNSASDALSE
jgi:glycogen debranching enzyme